MKFSVMQVSKLMLADRVLKLKMSLMYGLTLKFVSHVGFKFDVVSQVLFKVTVVSHMKESAFDDAINSNSYLT